MTPSASDRRQLHLMDPEVMECPHRYYADLHADPLPARDEGPAGWIVPGYRDLVALSGHPALSNEFHGPGGMTLMGISPEPFSPQVRKLLGTMRPMANVMLFSDPPTHTRTKALSYKALNPGRVRAMEPLIQRLVDMLIDTFVDDGECDLLEQFAVPLPAHLMGNLLGIDTAHLEDFKRWVDHTVMGVGDALDNEQRLVVGRSIKEFQEYLLERIAARREMRTDDLLDAIVHAELTLDDVDADGAVITGPRRLGESEILSIVIQLLGGGNHTTTQLISLTIAHLLANPAAMDAVRADPSLVGNALEETLRLDSPVQFGRRIVTAPVRVGEVEVPAGTTMGVCWGAAGHDPEVFPEPLRFDIHRENLRKHMSFGHGRHFCVGANLARAEALIAVSTLLRRLEDIRLVEGTVLTHIPSFTFTGLVSLPVTFTRSG
ncbi:MAG TPA: cytochrome P450 [Pseudonocardia sp.]|nr:cytochrome P450 [Pseudonocardia sp.]